MTIQSEAAAAWPVAHTTSTTEWLDNNGHVNLRHYLRLSAQGLDHLMREILSPGSPAQYFSFESRILYKRETMADQQLAVSIRPLSIEGNRVRALSIVERVSPDPVVATVCEWEAALIDPETRAELPLPAQARETLLAKIAQAPEPYVSPYYPPVHVLPDGPGSPVRIHDCEIKPEWTGENGEVEFQHFASIFFNIGNVRRIGVDFHGLRQNGMSGFAMETRVTYRKPLLMGERAWIHSRLHALGRKTLSIKHDIYGDEAATDLRATSHHTMAFVDFQKRRTIPLPAMVLQHVREIHGPDVPDPNAA